MIKAPTQEQINELKPKPVEGLNSLDMDGIANYIKENRAKNVCFVIGAGISCAAGIPDFRTPGTGLYYNLQKYNLPQPESIFTLDYFNENPKPFFELAKETMPGNYKPTYAHYLPIIFHRHGILLRVFTQNIDGLERVAGLPSDKVVECHGTYFTAHCQKCRAEYELKDIKDTMLKGEIPKCKECQDGVIKPDIVFFGEGLPERFFTLAEEDLPNCDLLIIIGTSLQVSPVNSIPEQVGSDVPRVLINNQKVNTYTEKLAITKENKLIDLAPYSRSNFYFRFDHNLNRRDVFLGGDCQKAVQELIRKLGWEDEYASIVPEDIFNKMKE